MWTSGRLNIAVSLGCIEALRPWHNPDLFSRGGSPGLGNVACCGHNRRINSRWGVVCEGMPTSGLWSEPQSPWHINRLELEAVFLALKDFRQTAGTEACYRTYSGTALADPHKEGSTISGKRLGLAPEPGVVEPSYVAASGI